MNSSGHSLSTYGQPERTRRDSLTCKMAGCLLSERLKCFEHCPFLAAVATAGAEGHAAECHSRIQRHLLCCYYTSCPRANGIGLVSCERSCRRSLWDKPNWRLTLLCSGSDQGQEEEQGVERGSHHNSKELIGRVSLPAQLMCSPALYIPGGTL